MSAPLAVHEAPAPYLVEHPSPLLAQFDLLAQAPGGIARLRELILSLAVRGKLVPQDPSDEPASQLLQRIQAEKAALVKAGKIKAGKALPEITEAEKPFELPGGWEWVRFGAMIDSSEAGWSPKCLEVPRTNGAWGVLKVSAVSWGVFKSHENKELPVGLEPRPEFEVRAEDLLISRANTEELVARSVIVVVPEAKLMMSDKIIRLNVSCLVDRHYLNLWNNNDFARPHYRENASGTSSSMKNVSREVIYSLPVPLPPLAEQTRIVARVQELMQLCDALEAQGKLQAAQHQRLVSTLFDALAASESAHALAENWQQVAEHFDLLLDRPAAVDALEQTILQLAVRGLLVPQDPRDEPASALLQKIRQEKDRQIAAGKLKKDKPLPPITEAEKPFDLPEGWEWARFGEVATISSGITLGRKTQLDDPVVLPYLRVANVQRWRVLVGDLKEISIDRSELERFQIKEGDLLITEGGDWDKVGRTAIWRNQVECCLHQNHVFKARAVVDGWNPVWAELYLNSHDARAYFAASAKQTTNLASINMTELKGCLFPVPPLVEQSRIVAQVEALRRLCADLRQSLATTQQTQSRLAEALVDTL